jgi:methylmalonyl-CoA/ethylmalonyl-CoA epimerase
VLPLLTRLDHVGIACRDLDRAVALYQATFGLEVASLRVGASAVSVAGVRPGYVQLLEPLSPDSPVGKFLARRGEGLHHVGYEVADVLQALVTVAGTGIRLVDERPRHGSMGASIGFLHPADLGGVLTELVQPLS